MNWQESLVRFVVGHVAPLIAIVAIAVFFVSARRASQLKGGLSAWGWTWQQFRELLGTDVMWIILLIELSVFAISIPVFGLTQCPKVGVDYLAYGAPCLAGMMAGMAVMYQRAEPKNNKQTAAVSVPPAPSVAPTVASDETALIAAEERGELKQTGVTMPTQGGNANAPKEPRLPLEYLFYIFSLVFLAVGYLSYVWLHFAYTTVTWLIIATCAAMNLGYFVPSIRRFMAHPRGYSEPATLALGVATVFLTATLLWFAITEKNVFSNADASIIQKACKDEESH